MVLSSSSIFAQAKLETERVWNFFVVERDQKIEKNFILKNSGDEKLIIRAINPSCSCIELIAPEGIFELIANEEIEIKLKLDTKGYIGKVQKSLYIVSNDFQNKIIRIQVVFEVAASRKSIVSDFSKFNFAMIGFAGLFDGINPCAFSVLVFFISFLTLRGYKKRQIAVTGISFIASVFLTYILLGVGLFSVFKTLSYFELISEIIYIFIAVLVLILGVVSLWDYFVFRRTGNFDSVKLKLPFQVKTRIQNAIRSEYRDSINSRNLIILVFIGFACGFLVSILESICTGQIYIPVITYIFQNTQMRLRAFLWLAIYNLFFVLPLIAVLIMALYGFNSDNFQNFMRKNYSLIKIVTALLFFFLGSLLLIFKFYV